MPRAKYNNATSIESLQKNKLDKRSRNKETDIASVSLLPTLKNVWHWKWSNNNSNGNDKDNNNNSNNENNHNNNEDKWIKTGNRLKI